MSVESATRPASRAPFQSWAQEQMKRLGINPGDVHRALVHKGHEVTEGYIYRLIQGKTAPKNPGYNVVLGIGEVLGDPHSALRLSGYSLPEKEIKIQDEKLAQWIELFPRDESARERIITLVKTAVEMTKAN
jgi:hypothetical protein